MSYLLRSGCCKGHLSAFFSPQHTTLPPCCLTQDPSAAFCAAHPGFCRRDARFCFLAGNGMDGRWRIVVFVIFGSGGDSGGIFVGGRGSGCVWIRRRRRWSWNRDQIEAIWGMRRRMKETAGLQFKEAAEKENVEPERK